MKPQSAGALTCQQHLAHLASTPWEEVSAFSLDSPNCQWPGQRNKGCPIGNDLLSAGGYPIDIYFPTLKWLEWWKANVEPKVMPWGSRQVPFHPSAIAGLPLSSLNFTWGSTIQTCHSTNFWIPVALLTVLLTLLLQVLFVIVAISRFRGFSELS